MFVRTRVRGRSTVVDVSRRHVERFGRFEHLRQPIAQSIAGRDVGANADLPLTVQAFDAECRLRSFN